MLILRNEFNNFYLKVAEICPIPVLDWLAVQVSRNPLAHSLVLQNLDQWVEPYLMQSCNQRVRTGKFI